MSEARRPYAHDAVLRPYRDDDVGAAGAAITVELCGHWQHEPPCPLAPHHTAAHRDGDELRLRILFAVEPSREREVRNRISSALSARWDLLRSEAAPVLPEEADHAQRLLTS